MATLAPTYSVAATLTASTVDRVTVTGNRSGLIIANRSPGIPDGLWYTWSLNGTPTDPTADGAADVPSFFLPPGGEHVWEDALMRSTELAIKVHLISTAAVAYYVATWA